MSGTIQTIKIDEMINYYENPRHAVGSNEQDTLKKLFDAVGIQYMLNLAEDIQKYGLLENQQIVVVYSGDINKYVVYEGNRRVAAIKLLLHPEHFDFLDRTTIDKAEKIAEEQDVIDTLDCYVTDEEEAFFIMERLHSGEDKGRGIKQWTPREKEAFRVRQNSVKNLSYLIDLYVKRFCDGLDITTILPFTTIQRIFNNREIRKQIGLDITSEDTFTSERMKLVVEASKWIVKESNSQGVAVTRLFNKAKAIEDKLLPWLLGNGCDENMNSTDTKHHSTSEDATKKDSDDESNKAGNDNEQKRSTNQDKAGLTTPTRSQNDEKDQGEESGDNAKADNTSSGGASTGSGGNKNLPYFFQGLNYGLLNPNDVDTHGITAVCREVQLFSDRKMVATYPLASAFLIRSVIEQTIKYYSKKHMIQGQNKYIWDNIKNIDKLSKVIANYNKNLPNYIVDSEMRQYFTSLFSDYEEHVDPLNWVVHRPSEFRLDANTLIELPKKGLLALINYMLS